jgi:hypothetical protein
MGGGKSLMTYKPSRRAQRQPYFEPRILRITDPRMTEALLLNDAHVHW